ncbi:MAG: stage II sporulation protein R [Lachnospiraceae bacterium]|nr:stage II sporulation protein R [Lachnospiraceae bacterium]MDY4969704.1 stage II sporulation protein R [Lachnospiraceae bacterium]
MFQHDHKYQECQKYQKNHSFSFRTAALAGLFLLMLLMHAALIQVSSVYARADSISDSVLRLRVIANSDSEEDQELKLAFKSRLCEVLKPYLTEFEDVNSAAEWISQNIDFIQKQADIILEDLQQSRIPQNKTSSDESPNTGSGNSSKTSCCSEYSRCTVSFTKNIFPTRTYGTLTFPPGNYRTLLVTLGNGQGHNWWCVLYPTLCFTDETTAVFPEEAQTKLQQTLTEEDYNSLTRKITLQLRLADLLKNLCLQ